MAQLQVSGLATQLRYQLVSTGIIQTECDIDILFTHRVCKAILNENLSKLFQEGNWCRIVLFLWNLKPQILLVLRILYFATFHLTIGRLQTQFWRNMLHIATNMHGNTSYIFETLRLNVQEHCVLNVYYRKKILP